MRKLRSRKVLKLCLIKYNNTYQRRYLVSEINTFIGIDT